MRSVSPLQKDGAYGSTHPNARAVTVLKPKPKTAVLRMNRTATEPRFSSGHVTVFLEFQKWPSPVTNVPKQQPNYWP